MKVICKINNVNNFTDKWLLKRLKSHFGRPSSGDIQDCDEILNIVIGQVFTVYGVVFWDNSPWYYIVDDEDDEYPTPYASEFFDVIDKRLSSYWNLSAVDSGEFGVISSLVFHEWAEDDRFYERLIDGDLEAEEKFNKYRQLMDQE